MMRKDFRPSIAWIVGVDGEIRYVFFLSRVEAGSRVAVVARESIGMSYTSGVHPHQYARNKE
jgi:hypothetical protein